MRRSAAALLAPALALVLLARGARAQFDSLCFPRDQFRFAITDKAGLTWRWDLSTLCKSSGSWSYSGFGTEGQTFFFNVGGNASVGCSDYLNVLPMYESWGVAVQLLQAGRGVNPRDDCLRADNSTCPDWTYGGDMCCSPLRCEVVALEPAVFTPLNASNLASGGVLLKHAGYPGSDNDFLMCPEQNTGLRRLRTFELNLACDPLGDASTLVVTGYNEGDDGEQGQYCRFQVYVKSLAACGVADPVVVPTPAPQSASDAISALVASGVLVGAGGQAGFVVLGCVLTLAVQWLVSHGKDLARWARGEGRASGNGLSFSAKMYTGVPTSAGGGARASTPLYGATTKNAFQGL
jgi:hypothetical protein